jgi:predicted Zn-dependent protease with MMP-like domain
VLQTHQTRRRQAARTKQASRERMTLMHPAFNLREIAKQLLLLEDHLQHHYCDDCIRKHLLLIEGFAEEAKSLDVSRLYYTIPDELAEMARRCMVLVTDAQDSDAIRDISEAVRKQRKALVPLVYDPRGVEAATRVASAVRSRGSCPHRVAAYHRHWYLNYKDERTQTLVGRLQHLSEQEGNSATTAEVALDMMAYDAGYVGDSLSPWLVELGKALGVNVRKSYRRGVEDGKGD